MSLPKHFELVRVLARATCDVRGCKPIQVSATGGRVALRKLIQAMDAHERIAPHGFSAPNIRFSWIGRCGLCGSNASKIVTPTYEELTHEAITHTETTWHRDNEEIVRTANRISRLMSNA